MMYKLSLNGAILKNGMSIPVDERNSDYQDYLNWLAEGNVPDPADMPTPEQVALTLEEREANTKARAYFVANPAAATFVRLTPEEQGIQIDGMTLAQLRTVIKYLTVATSALIKRELL